MINPLTLIKNGVFKENPSFVLLLGICPTLAVTSSAADGFGMGLAATVVLMGSNVVISAIRKFIPDEIRIPAFIVVIAGFVTVVQLLISGYAPALDKSLGIFIPLIVVNCIILARAEAFAFKHNIVESLFDGVGMGMGFTLALTIMGSIRELFGNGSIFNHAILPPAIEPALLMILAPGGFITFGILVALFRAWQIRKEEQSSGVISTYDGWQKLGACEGCGLHSICGGGNATVPCAKEETKEAEA